MPKWELVAGAGIHVHVRGMRREGQILVRLINPSITRRGERSSTGTASGRVALHKSEAHSSLMCPNVRA